MLNAPLAAHMACDDAGLNFARTFRGQFTLSASCELTIEGFRVIDLGQNGWRLHHCRKLPVARIHDHGGAFAGVMLGIAIDAAGKHVTDGYHLAFGETPQSFVTGAAGRYVMITPTAVYADPTGSMGGVYDASTKTVASSLLMCLNRPPIAPAGFNAEAIQSGKGAYSLGYTRDADVRQITPNHSLNLGTFQLTRFWPTADVDYTDHDPDQIIADMSERLTQVIGAIAQSQLTLLPLTGGRDSRNLAACAMPHLAQIDGTFTFVSNWQGTIDAEVGAMIAEAMDLPHDIYASYTGDAGNRDTINAKARQRQKMAYRLAAGYVGDANNDVLDGLAQKLPAGVVLRGNVMEMVKANSWKRGLAHDAAHPDGHDVDYAMERLGIDATQPGEAVATLRHDYLTWLRGLPVGAQHLSYDFAYAEQLLPPWQAKFYGYSRNFFINPFSDRALITGCLQLPVKERQANVYNDALLAHAAPGLADIPFTPDLKLARKTAA